MTCWWSYWLSAIVKRLTADFRKPEDETRCPGLILVFDSWIHIPSQDTSIKIYWHLPVRQKNPKRHRQNFIWEEKGEAKTIKYFVWLTYRCRIIRFEFRMALLNPGLNDQVFCRLTSSIPSCQKGWRRQASVWSSLLLQVQQLWGQNWICVDLYLLTLPYLAGFLCWM